MDAKSRRSGTVPGWGKALITLVVIVGAAALIFTPIFTHLRGSFSTDLSIIGQGTPAIVVGRDINFLAGEEVMSLLNRIRPEFADRVEFLAVNLGNPQVQGFVRQHRIQDGTVLLFSADGTRVGALDRPTTEREVRQLLGAANIH